MYFLVIKIKSDFPLFSKQYFLNEIKTFFQLSHRNVWKFEITQKAVKHLPMTCTPQSIFHSPKLLLPFLYHIFLFLK